MKKVIYLILLAIALVGCKKSDTIIGTWVKSESEEVFTGGNVGMVSTFTFNQDGTLEEKHELQAGANNEDFSLGLTLVGKWQMPSEDKLIVHMEKAIVKGEEMVNKKDVEYTIVKIDNESLEMMSGGKTEQYRRK